MSEREKAIQLIKEMPDNKMIFAVKILRDIKGLPAEENEPDGEKQIREEAFLQLESMRKDIPDLDYEKELTEYQKGRYGRYNN